MIDFERETIHYVKIVVLGESGVGKTAILNQYINEEFSPNLKSTIGADMLVKDMELEQHPNKLIKLQVIYIYNYFLFIISVHIHII